MRLLLFLLVLAAPIVLHAQTGSDRRIVRLEETIRAGIDRDAIDSVYINGSSRGCTDCRFDASQEEAYTEGWNAFLGELLNRMLVEDVSFSELIVRAYFGADGRLDYLLYHVGGDNENNRRFVSAVESVRSTFRFPLEPRGPFKQTATISLGAPVMGE